MRSNGLVRKAAVGLGLAFTAMTVAALPANAATTAQPDGQATINGMKFYDDYWTLSECRSVGEWGLDAGKWSVYYCQEDILDWNLYYDN
ncbi:hypothetical protein [Amycolatopsis aidingensis]|uniref:hypothetical protein n=1 Tax=Amycolatopsis aidingensis TaxID=2842453 RepID=UPI001C0B5084|nr:hypothetical protein [Amycolatopsis aidingensis]